jgi:hypothetical protein
MWKGLWKWLRAAAFCTAPGFAVVPGSCHKAATS